MFDAPVYLEGRAQVAATQYGDLRLVDASIRDDAGRQLVRLSTLLYRH